MKKLLIILFSLVLTLSLSAQHRIGGAGRFYGGSRISVGFGAYAPFYPFWGYGYGYGRYYNPPYNNSKLAIKIQDIKNDYADKIWSAKHDTSLTRKERRHIVHQLRYERDLAINDAKRNYWKN
jgi:hypothetical protein